MILTFTLTATKAGEIWASLPDEELEYWRQRSAEETELHKLLYPDYGYQPRKSTDIKRRAGKKKEQRSTGNATAQAPNTQQPASP